MGLRSSESGKRIALEVRSGPLAGRAAEIGEGETLRVGRAKKADFTIGNDAQMSGVHFAIEHREGAFVLRDLDSANGTFLNGDRIAVARLHEGDRLRAGETTFVVRFVEATAPAPAPLPALVPGPAARLRDVLAAEPAPVFVVLDAARDRRVKKLLRAAGSEATSLYDGWQGEVLADYAPHIVPLAPGSPILDTLVREGWGQSWGVYLTSARRLADVRRHLRRFLIVKDDDTNEDLYFRFYDPRVLRVFLGCCTPRQSGMFLEDIGAFLVEGETPETLIRFSPTAGGVTRAVIPLGP